MVEMVRFHKLTPVRNHFTAAMGAGVATLAASMCYIGVKAGMDGQYIDAAQLFFFAGFNAALAYPIFHDVAVLGKASYKDLLESPKTKEMKYG